MPDRGTSLSVTEGVAASGAVILSIGELVLGPEDEAVWTGTGLETAATGTFLNKPCWLPVLDTEDYKGQKIMKAHEFHCNVASTLYKFSHN